MKALGMVETKGLVCVVEALDAMLKTADVSFAATQVATVYLRYHNLP